jgi:hypothetical protein
MSDLLTVKYYIPDLAGLDAKQSTEKARYVGGGKTPRRWEDVGGVVKGKLIAEGRFCTWARVLEKENLSMREDNKVWVK